MSAERKKVLFLIRSLGKGGAERVLVNLLNRFDLNTYEVDLCLVMDLNIYDQEINRQINRVTLFKSYFLVRVLTFLYTRYNINLLWKSTVNRKLRERYDVAISFADSSYTDLLFMLDHQPRKTITWVHSSYNSYSNFNKFYSGARKERIKKARFDKLSTVVFVSEDSKRSFIEVFGEKYHMEVIYNIIDRKGVLSKAKEFEVKKQSKEILIVSLGSLYPVKGFDKLIEAASDLLKENDRVRLMILGDGPLRKQLQEQIDALQLNEKITLEGFKPNPYPYLAAADIFCMSSISEALPTALCEAMILGKPTLVTDCDGCREIVAGGKYGIMVKGYPFDIYQGLLKMSSDTEIRKFYSLKSIERASGFDDEEILKKVYHLIDK
ncbi:glycosyltransferase [Imperialibacter roseus]|uniref:Glycosyltransferase n=1 Tax=Imperialibacter roseus TaxID=1324217 RepID=A0ABZ0ILI0_9BACT|nr:glycosyltransferase [Imperialibacter roseus]WOK05367.1 glycosyltransferase [Imperialibacter roseus]